MALSAGTRLGHFEIETLLGVGGMGEVYRARDARLDRSVAIKVLPAAFLSDPDRRARFESEAHVIAALSHPNILAIHDIGVHDGHTFVVTELLEGETLRDRLHAGAVPVRKAIDWAVQISRALAAAHEKAIVHRDLKPENVFLIADGQVKLIDFGLAKAHADRGALEPMTATVPGTVMGTSSIGRRETSRRQSGPDERRLRCSAAEEASHLSLVAAATARWPSSAAGAASTKPAVTARPRAAVLMAIRPRVGKRRRSTLRRSANVAV